MYAACFLKPFEDRNGDRLEHDFEFLNVDTISVLEFNLLRRNTHPVDAHLFFHDKVQAPRNDEVTNCLNS
jgi:hypothetical protein